MRSVISQPDVPESLTSPEGLILRVGRGGEGQVPRRGVDPSRRSGAQAGARAISFRAVVATTG